MPRSDKPISTGNLSGPVSSARGRTWVTHASPEDSDQYEPDGLVVVDQLTSETVEAVVDLADGDSPTVTINKPGRSFRLLEAVPVYEWTTDRSIESRIYKRRDERHHVDADE